jgi:hypothetical protein
MFLDRFCNKKKAASTMATPTKRCSQNPHVTIETKKQCTSKVPEKPQELQTSLFHIGDRVRIAHENNIQKVLDCSHVTRFFSTCPFEDDGKHRVGRFGYIHKIMSDQHSILEKITEIPEPSSSISFYIRLEKLPSETTSTFIEMMSMDAVNYTVLEKDAADKVFEETRDRGFPWTDCLNNPESLLNNQMLQNLNLLDDDQRSEIETTIQIFQEQAHALYHRLFLIQLDANRLLRLKYHRELCAGR